MSMYMSELNISWWWLGARLWYFHYNEDAPASHQHSPIKWLNTLRLRQNGRHFADDPFKCIFLNENVWISLRISLKFVPRVRINNIPPLVPIMAWCWSGDKPLSKPMMVSLLTNICVSRPQWVKKTITTYQIIIKQLFVQLLDTYVPLSGESTGHWWISLTNGQ